MADKYETDLIESLMEFYKDPDTVDKILDGLEARKGNPEEYKRTIEGLKRHMASSEEAPSPRTTFKDNKMVTKGPKYTEKINTNMVGNTGDFTEKMDYRKLANEAGDLATDAKKGALEGIRDKNAAKMFGGLDNVIGGAKRFGKGAGKLAKGGLKAIPLAGPALVGGATYLASGGDAQAAAGEILDSEALGEGSDEVGDMDISLADLGIAERKGIEAQEEREDEEETKKRKFGVLD